MDDAQISYCGLGVKVQRVNDLTCNLCCFEVSYRYLMARGVRAY